MNDYIEIFDENNISKKMEVVCTYKLSKYNSNYIIYCELDKSHYYIAKYKNNDISDLDTNLNDDEFNIGNEILKELTNESRN